MTATKLERALGRAMANADASLERSILKDRKRRAYEATTAAITIRGWRGFGRTEPINRSRLGQVRFIEAHTSHFTRLGDPTPRTEEQPDQIGLDSNMFRMDQAADRIRRMRAADARRIARLDERIRQLQNDRQAAIEAAHERGIKLTPGQLKAAGLKNKRVADGGFRGYGPKVP